MANLFNDYLAALAQAGQLGVMDFGSTIQKGITPYTQGFANAVSPSINKGLNALGIPAQVSAMTPELAQRDYEQNIKDTMNNPAVQQHPIFSSLARTGGNLAAISPLLAMGGGATGPSVLSTAGNAAATNMIAGGLMNQPGQDPNQVVNPKNALIGGVGGAVLGAGQKAVSNYLTNIGKASAKSLLGILPNSTEESVSKIVDPVTGMVNSKSLSGYPKIEAAIGGLEKLFSLATNNPTITGASVGASIGGYLGGKEGATVGGIVGGGIGLAPSVISKILSYSPLQKTLSMANSLGNKLTDNPELATMLLNKATDQMANAGIAMYTHSNGTELRMKTEVNPDIKPKDQSQPTIMEKFNSALEALNSPEVQQLAQQAQQQSQLPPIDIQKLAFQSKNQSTPMWDIYNWGNKTPPSEPNQYSIKNIR